MYRVSYTSLRRNYIGPGGCSVLVSCLLHQQREAQSLLHLCHLEYVSPLLTPSYTACCYWWISVVGCWQGWSHFHCVYLILTLFCGLPFLSSTYFWCGNVYYNTHTPGVMRLPPACSGTTSETMGQVCSRCCCVTTTTPHWPIWSMLLLGRALRHHLYMYMKLFLGLWYVSCYNNTFCV